MRRCGPRFSRRNSTAHSNALVEACSDLYGVDLWDLSRGACAQLDNAISGNYAHPFDWYRTVMRKAGFSRVIRPVHPEYYVRQESSESARQEALLHAHADAHRSAA